MHADCNANVTGGYKKRDIWTLFGQQGKVQIDRPADPWFLLHLGPCSFVFFEHLHSAATRGSDFHPPFEGADTFSFSYGEQRMRQIFR